MCTMVPTRPIGRFPSGRSDGSTRDRRSRGMLVMSAMVSRSFGCMGGLEVGGGGRSIEGLGDSLELKGFKVCI